MSIGEVDLMSQDFIDPGSMNRNETFTRYRFLLLYPKALRT